MMINEVSATDAVAMLASGRYTTCEFSDAVYACKVKIIDEEYTLYLKANFDV